MKALELVHRLVPIVTVLSLSAGHTNLYTTPRTIPKGKVVHTAAIESPNSTWA